MSTDATKDRRLLAKHILKKVFFEDWALKLVALAITLTLWFGVTGSITPTTRRMTVPLNLVVASNAQVMNSPQQEVEIEVSGDKRRIDEINRSELSLGLDLTELSNGEHIVTLTPNAVFIPLPQGVKLTDIAPARIAVNLESVEEKDLEVRADITGEPAPGHQVYSTTILPASVKVRGPSSVMRILDYIETDKIDVTGKKADVTMRQVDVRSPNPKAVITNTFVDVMIKIGEKKVDRTISVTLDTGQTVSVTLSGPRSIVSRITASELSVRQTVDLNGNEGFDVDLPEDVSSLIEIGRVRRVN